MYLRSESKWFTKREPAVYGKSVAGSPVETELNSAFDNHSKYAFETDKIPFKKMKSSVKLVIVNSTGNGVIFCYFSYKQKTVSFMEGGTIEKRKGKLVDRERIV